MIDPSRDEQARPASPLNRTPADREGEPRDRQDVDGRTGPSRDEARCRLELPDVAGPGEAMRLREGPHGDDASSPVGTNRTVDMANAHRGRVREVPVVIA